MSATSAPEAEAPRTPTEVSHSHTGTLGGSHNVHESAPSQRPSDDASPTHTSTGTAPNPADQQAEPIMAEEVSLASAATPNPDHTISPATTLRPSPLPSAKRRESEADLDTPEPKKARAIKKQKRSTSPPWRLPIAPVSTLKTADGRRISARHNPSTPGASETEGRGRSGSQSLSRSRPASPPWKRFAAEGPTTLQVDGLRKSGRVNKELSETPKRVSPRSKKQVDRLSMPRQRNEERTAFGRKTSMVGRNTRARLEAKRHAGESERPLSSSSNGQKIADLEAQIAALETTRSFISPSEDRLNAPYKRKSSRNIKPEPLSPPTSRRLRGFSHPDQSPDEMKPSPKIKLRFTTPRQVIAPPHPQAKMPSPLRPPQRSLYQLIEAYELKEMQQPYTETDRGPPSVEDFSQRAAKQAVEEGTMRQRLIKEAKPGGVLSRDRLSLYQDDRQPEPLQQYSHADHLVSHALYLRTLQVREKTQHRLLAKKLAFEALEKWKSRNGPTEEDIIAEQNKINELVKKQVVADLKALWERVEKHVREAKKRIWEQEQERIRARKLQEKLEFSESLLAKQRGEADRDSDGDSNSDIDMDEDSTGDIPDSESDSGIEDSEEENMSESGSESGGNDNAEEEGEMDEDTLAAYLAQRDAEPPDKDDEDDTVNAEVGEESQIALDENDGQDDSTSDESTDMDSDEDMSSTGDEMIDFEDDGDDDDDDDDDDDNTDDGSRAPGLRGSLLGFYSTKQLLRERDGGLPTPMTSVENGGDNDNPMPDSKSSKSDEEVEPPHENLQAPGVPQDVLMHDELELPDSETEGDSDRDKTLIDAQLNEPSIGAAQIDDPVDEKVSPVESPSQDAEEEELEISGKIGTAMETAEEAATKDLVPVPSLLRGTLRSYQHAGLDWLASLYRNGTNGILADEMGLGKTIQTISLLAHLAEVHEVWEPHLVIVPTSVILNWVTEFQKFLPGFRVLGYYGTAEERQHKRKGWINDPHYPEHDKRGYNVVITSYNVAMQDINAIRNVQWHYLVLDEAHNIRNFNSQRWQVLIRLRTRARLLLTGTPLQNDLAEVWSLLTFLTAGDDDRSHGELEEFLSHWKDPVKEIFDQGVQKISQNAQRVVDQLHISLRPFLLRRKKSEVEKDLPKKTESVVVCKLSKRQRQLYQDYMGLAETRETLAKGSGVQAGAVLLSLRRVCNHPDLFDPRPIQTSFAMDFGPLEQYSAKENLVRRLLGAPASVPEHLLIVSNEHRRRKAVKRSRNLRSSRALQQHVKELESHSLETSPDPSTLSGARALQRHLKREEKLQHLRASIQTTEAAIRSMPVYGADLREILVVRNEKPYTFARRSPNYEKSLREWTRLGHKPLRLDHLGDLSLVKATRLQQDIATLDGYADRLQETIVKFAFVPPAAIAPVMDYTIPRKMQEALRSSPAYPMDRDWGHEARIRTSIAFPDSRLLIFDSGKLQRLVYLLRELQSKGSRSLIFTQMTGTLNILEQFLNLLNLPYLRLDGGTPVERRQLYSAEFNRPDSKYQCMILSSRAGGVGLNLTGASSVIFYDLDWNPQMDRQCMDRAHRIGQVRDVEVYKMVSEKTVEENILRRANQKSLLDETVIQQGHFTTEYQHPARRDAPPDAGEDDVAAAIDRLLGTEDRANTKALESVEDQEDVRAAQQAAKEDRQDDVDFAERSSKGPSKANTPGPAFAEEGDDDGAADRKGHIDNHMIQYMEHLLRDWRYAPAPVRKLDKHGRDPSHRPKRKR